MKKYMLGLSFIIIIYFLFTLPVFATEEITQIDLSRAGILVNGEEITEDINQNVYLTNKTDNGGSSENAKDANIKIDYIININKGGIYEISGALSDCQIAINANNVKGDVNLILNGVDLLCYDAPAIFIYCKNYTLAQNKVTITSKEDTINTISGGRIKESVIDWTDQDEIIYHIDKGYDRLDKESFEEYKYNGAISSDLSLIFNGTGTLNVFSYKKEGIEVKKDITFDDGIYNITAMDDAINTYDAESIVEINGGTLIANVFREAEEGDGIDSNGSIIINGGNVYVFAYSDAESGLDAEYGTQISGGTFFTYGYIYQPVFTSGNNKVIQTEFENEIKKGETIVAVDQDGNALFAFKTDRVIKSFSYSSNDLKFESFEILVGEKIPKDLSYSLLDLNSKIGKEIELLDIKMIDINKEVIVEKQNFSLIYIIILILIIIFILVIYKFLKLKRRISYRKKI